MEISDMSPPAPTQDFCSFNSFQFEPQHSALSSSASLSIVSSPSPTLSSQSSLSLCNSCLTTKYQAEHCHLDFLKEDYYLQPLDYLEEGFLNFPGDFPPCPRLGTSPCPSMTCDYNVSMLGPPMLLRSCHHQQRSCSLRPPTPRPTTSRLLPIVSSPAVPEPSPRAQPHCQVHTHAAVLSLRLGQRG